MTYILYLDTSLFSNLISFELPSEFSDCFSFSWNFYLKFSECHAMDVGGGNAGNGNAGNPGFHPIFNPDYRMPLDEFFRQLITTTILGPDAQPFQISGCEEKPPGWEEKSQSDK